MTICWFFFSKEFWDLTEADVMGMLKEFQQGTPDLNCLNKSYLFLLPEYAGAIKVGHYRPIALSNWIYISNFG